MAVKKRTKSANTSEILHEIRMIPIAQIKPAPYNPRKIDDAALAGLTKSLERFGYVEPIIWNQRTGFVVGGHQRLKILRAKKIKEIPVTVVDLDDTEEKALNVALNSAYISGEFTGDLQGLLAEIKGKDHLLFSELRLDALLSDIASTTLAEDADAVPVVPKTAKTKTGDLYALGDHRLLCGDSTQEKCIAVLLDALRVDVMVTDPPYGVDYSAKNAMLNARDGGKRIEKDIENDAGKDYRVFFGAFLAVIPWADYASFYICMSSLELHNLRLAVEDCGLTWGDYLVWVKNNHVLGRKDYNSKHEFILYGWAKKHRFYANGHRTTVLEYARPQVNDVHPTMKPVELMQQLITDGSQGGGVVYEPFAGSGTTIIASEITGRQCRAIEMDPLYCDVVVKRWEDFTKKKATLIHGAP